jgi:monovalent cation:H+ antiporter-2, CPA2 family
MPQKAPFVFLSHSGADTEAARRLKRQLEAAPEAQNVGLKVWFDKDDLRPGTPWPAQIARAIQKEATAFLVYVASGGIMNWVDAEIDLALSRATTSNPSPLLFIPVLAAEVKGFAALPAFAKRYQGVRDPLSDAAELAKLIKAILHADWDTTPKLLDEPFVGLRAMREEESDRFFGRTSDVSELTDKLRKHRIVAVVANSGTGKSSLAQAGFVPAFRGGKLIDPAREDAREKIWHVVIMRPGADPAAGLRQGLTESAEKIGRSVEERAVLRRQISVEDGQETAYALQCGLPSTKTSTLLIVEQFEELLTTSPEKDAADFSRFLFTLADSASDVRVLITVRADYFNLASGIKDASDKPTLFDRLTADNNDAILRLRAMSADGVREAVCKPLQLAGEHDESANRALVRAVESDISNQASDLPLLQVALRAAWQERRATSRPILECYQSVGRVSGALAREADKARHRLRPDDQARLESIFVRLVRLGDTGGATRRSASLNEFDSARKALLQKLAGDEYGRLIAVGEKSAELSHEALITQWPWLQGALKTDTGDLRGLDRLMARAREWDEAIENRKDAYLASGAERELYGNLAERRSDWLSIKEKDYVHASEEAYRTEQEAKRAEAEAHQRQRDLDQTRQLAAATRLAAVERRERLLTLNVASAIAIVAVFVAVAAWRSQVEKILDPSVYKEILLFLVTAGVVAPLVFRLRVSPVLAFLLAGVALGPYGLGSIDLKVPWLNALAINVEAIDPIAGFGVIALMFTTGLELSFERLRRMRRQVFGIGLAQVVLTTLILGTVAYGVGLAPPSAFAVGAAMSLSSTAIVIPVLVDSKRLNSDAGRATLGVLLFQSLAVAPLLVMMGALPAVGERGLAWELLRTLIPSGLALAALVLFGRLALRPFFHFVAETKISEFFMAMCLLVVVASGFAAAAGHLSLALGAMVAGLLLGQTEYRREIEVVIEPFRGLLLGVYFVSVGATINPGFIFDRLGLVLGLSVAFVAAKGLTLFGLGRAFRLPSHAAAETSLLLGPGGEFGFVLIGIVLAGGLIDRSLAMTLVSAVAISMLVIPVLAAVGARIGSAPRGAAHASPEGIPPDSDASRVIIVGYGRVGALIGDMLDRHSIPFIAVDSNARVAGRARSGGKPVYYGDASRPEYLRLCGLETARAVVVTMDSTAANEEVVETTRQLRPNITLIARARDVDHARALYELGATDVVPGAIEASLQLSEAVLTDLGVPMGLIIASIHEKRDEYRKLLMSAADAPERSRSIRRSQRA